MSDKMTAVKEFKASRDMADSLRLELSSISPSKDRQNRELVSQVAEDLMGRYSQFMTLENLTTLQTAHERTITLDRKLLGRFASKKDNMSKADKEQLGGFFLKRGKLSLVADMVGDRERYFYNDAQEVFLKVAQGDSVKAKELGDQALVDTFLIHETIHHAQDRRWLPEDFLEYGVQYYLNQVAESIHTPFYYQPEDFDSMANVYQKLLANHGKNVHKLAFGTLLDPKQRETILHSFHEIKKEGSSPTLPDGASDVSLPQIDPKHERIG